MLTLRNGEATVVDANSRNGVYVNGIQVRYAKLEDGDVVTFGTVRFRYRVGASAAGSAYPEA
jgi:pSer/pThr/pTyr-binding forkhead associated (FHA) protein